VQIEAVAPAMNEGQAMSRRNSKSSRGPYLLETQLLRDRIPALDRYPFCLPAVRNLSRLEFHPGVTFFVGENGSGKSTLIEGLAIACDLNPEGGSRNFNFESYASHSQLEKFVRVARTGLPPDSFFLRAESFYNVASEIDRLGVNKSYGGMSFHKQSHGESFFALFERRFGFRKPGRPPLPGLYFLDEPEAALSPGRQLQFLALLHQYCSEGSQFIIATHSPIIMAYPESWIYLLDKDGIRLVPYVETEHYRVTRAFLDNPQRMLTVLLEDSGTNPSDQQDHGGK
jgi:predicted ATPase